MGLSCFATTQKELIQETSKFLSDKGLTFTENENGISWKNSDNMDFEIQIVPADNLFLMQIGYQQNVMFDTPKNDDYSEKLLSFGQFLQARIPLIKISLSGSKGGDLALLKGGNPNEIAVYSCNCNIQNLISDSKMLNEVLPLFYSILSDVSKVIKENVEDL